MRTRWTRPLATLVCFLPCALLPACAADPGDDPKGEATPATASNAPQGSASPAIPSSTGTNAPPPSRLDAGSSEPSGPLPTNDGGSLEIDATGPVPQDAGPTPPRDAATGALSLRYLASATSPSTKEIKPHYEIVNNGSFSQPLSEITARYWFTIDGTRPQVYACDYAAAGCANIQGKFAALSPVRTGADAYFEISFTAGAGSLAPGGTASGVQNRFNKDDYSNYDQSNDYSFDATQSKFSDWSRVTLYRTDQLVWGKEPP
jgi:endoglucanase